MIVISGDRRVLAFYYSKTVPFWVRVRENSLNSPEDDRQAVFFSNIKIHECNSKICSGDNAQKLNFFF